MVFDLLEQVAEIVLIHNKCKCILLLAEMLILDLSRVKADILTKFIFLFAPFVYLRLV